jgi:hypothetical protein
LKLNGERTGQHIKHFICLEGTLALLTRAMRTQILLTSGCAWNTNPPCSFATFISYSALIEAISR